MAIKTTHITRHAELCEWLIDRIKEVPFLAENLRKREMLAAIDQDSLKTFFDYGLNLGIFVEGGSYEGNPATRGQVETANIVLAIGSSHLGGAAQPLGSGAEPGCWDVLEPLRELFSGAKSRNGTNLMTLEPRRWHSLLAIAGLAIIGLELRVEIFRHIDDGRGLDIYGGGYLGTPKPGAKTPKNGR